MLSDQSSESSDMHRPRSHSSRILLAVYHFPPSAAVGGLRATRFARFLPDFGWEPFVLTVADADRDPLEGVDRSRLIGLERVPLMRTHARSGPMALYTRFKKALRRDPASRAVDVRRQSDSGNQSGVPTETLAKRLKRYIASLFILLPDEQKNWSMFAAPAAVRLIRKHEIDWIFTSGPPFSVHFIGWIAKLLTRARWVADFRDPWLEMMPERPPHSKSWLSERLEAWMEARVFRNADIVLTTTERMRQSMVARYPTLPADKFACLPNGVDDFRPPLDASQKYDRLTITYAGTLYLDRSPEPLFRAFGALVSEGRATVSDFRIKLVGSCRFIGEVETQEIAKKYGVEEAVEIIDRVPHTEAIEIMRRSHLLLVLAPPNHQLVLPAKIFDYFGSGSQVLALAQPGATADLMRETGGGSCFAETDIEGLKEYFCSLLRDGAYRQLRNEAERFTRYEARYLTGQLVQALSRPAGDAEAMTVRT